MKKIFLSFIFCSIVFSVKSQSNYTITIHLKNCKDTIAYLTYYQFDKTLIKDTCRSIKNGKIVFTGNGKLEKGIYSLVSQQKTIYFDFFVDNENQNLEFKNDMGRDVFEGLYAVNSPLENAFFDYVKFIAKQNKAFQNYKQSIELKNQKDSLHLIDKQKEFDQLIQEYEHKFLDKNRGTYIADVMNLKMEKVLKDVPKASNGRPDSLVVYKYYRNHYWDDVNFKDEGTMRNPFFFPKFKKYFESVVPINPDSVTVEIDKILDKPIQGGLMYKLMLAHLIYNYETSKIMGFDKVFVHISDNYLKKGKALGIYDNETVVSQIIKRADLLKPLLIGEVAPDLAMIKASDFEICKEMGFESAKNSDEVTKVFYDNVNAINKMFLHLNSIKADYLILVFWDVDCGHCQKEIPKLLTLYNEIKNKMDVKVFGVYTLYEGEKYLKTIEEKGLKEWINVYDGAHFNNVIQKYDVYSTPVIYILDKDKKIKAKRIGVEQIKNILNQMEQEYKN